MAIKTDREGYLVNLNDWDETVAETLAISDGIQLTSEHWQVIHFLRNFYLNYQTTPTVRIMVKELAKQMGVEKSNSIYLQRLFPQGLIKQTCKIAGLPKPVRCI